MNRKNHSLDSLLLGTIGLLVLAAQSGCAASAAPTSPTDSDASVDASAPTDVPDATPATPADDGGTLEGGACAAGTADCDRDPRNGCEVRLDDPKHCGACSHDCTALAHVSGATSCSAGKCVVPAASCARGWAHCSSNADDGCEADLSKATTCGACGTSCSGATPVCASGSCSSGCPSSAPSLCGSSCVDTATSATNCGGCGTTCSAPSHAQATCASAHCGFACNTGYHACSGACADDTSPLTCGASCTPCSAPAHAQAICTSGSCDFACDAGYHRCGGACVADDDATACGASCTVCTVPSGAGHATCSSMTCGISCDAGNHLCNGTQCASNTSVATCGTSCTPCAAPASNGHATCDGTSCGIACDASYHSCGADCDSNNSVSSCGTSCTPCAAPASNGHATCDGTSCGIACDASYHQCGGNCDSNSSVSSCGASCTPCPVPANAQAATCNGTSCGFTCLPGFADCDHNAANGCEVNLNADGNNCKTCGHSCLGGACSAATCQPTVLASAPSLGPIAARQDIVYYASGQSVSALHTNRAPVGTLRYSATPISLATGTYAGYLIVGLDSGEVDSTYASSLTNTVALLASGSGQRPSSVALVGVNAYWGNASNTANEIWSASALGDVPSLRITEQAPGGFFTAPNLLSMKGNDNNGFVWAISNESSSTIKVADASLNVTATFSVSGRVTKVAVDSGAVYWISNGGLWTSMRNGNGAVEMFQSTTVLDIATDSAGTGVYFTSAADSAVRFTPGWTAPLFVLASGGAPNQIATTPTFIAWTDPASNRVMLLAK